MRKSKVLSIIGFTIKLSTTAFCVIIRALAETDFVQRESNKAAKWWVDRKNKTCPIGCDHNYHPGCVFSELSN